jgi:hypothetical protein
MTNYQCTKCNKEFVKRDSFNKHIGRKYSCVPNDDPMTKLRKEYNQKILNLETKINNLNDKVVEISSKLDK